MTYELQDYLATLHSGQWCGFNGEHTYANLVIYDDSIPKPSEASCTEGLAKMQDDYDALEYSRQRKENYPVIGDQLDMLWHAIDTNTLDKTSDFYSNLKTVKDTYPKE